LKQNLHEISYSPPRTLTTHKINQVGFLKDNKGRMKLKSRVWRGIYRVGKPMSAAGKVLKSIVHLVLLGHTSDTICRVRRTIGRVRPMVPSRTSTCYLYYLQNMSSAIDSTSNQKVSNFQNALLSSNCS
jgi:hypothetical protein